MQHQGIADNRGIQQIRKKEGLERIAGKIEGTDIGGYSKGGKRQRLEEITGRSTALE